MRLGIAVRLFGIVVLVAFLGLQGVALKTRAFDGEKGHYTVVLKEGENAQLIASQHDEKGVDVEEVVNYVGISAYTGVMAEKKADKLLADDTRVAYVERDSTVKVRHNWWDTMQITLNNFIPHI